MLSQHSHTVLKAAVHSGPIQAVAGLPRCGPLRAAKGARRIQSHTYGLSSNYAAGALTSAPSDAVHSLKQLRSIGELLRHCQTVGQALEPEGADNIF
jgi:hypothetical protein